MTIISSGTVKKNETISEIFLYYVQPTAARDIHLASEK